MNQQEFIGKLKQALQNLPSAESQRIVEQYEQHFVAGLSAGRSEAEIIKDLGDPQKLANKLIAKTHLSRFFAQKTFGNLWRLLISVIGLVFFNLFMTIPAVIYLSLLVSSYMVAIAFFIAGSVATASGLSGISAMQFDQQTLGAIDISSRSNQENIEIGRGKGVQIHTDKHGDVNVFAFDGHSNQERVAFGLLLSVGGILLLLLSLFVSKYTFIGIKHYLRMNWEILRAPFAYQFSRPVAA